MKVCKQCGGKESKGVEFYKKPKTKCKDCKRKNERERIRKKYYENLEENRRNGRERYHLKKQEETLTSSKQQLHSIQGS